MSLASFEKRSRMRTHTSAYTSTHIYTRSFWPAACVSPKLCVCNSHWLFISFAAPTTLLLLLFVLLLCLFLSSNKIRNDFYSLPESKQKIIVNKIKPQFCSILLVLKKINRLINLKTTVTFYTQSKSIYDILLY